MQKLTKSLAIAFAAMAVLAVAASADTIGALYDDFCCQTYLLVPDGTVSPNGKWVNIWNGGGSSGVEINNSNYVMFLKPKKATGGSTRSAFIRTNSTWSDFEVSFDARTIQQLKNTPRNWEVDWLIFRYTNTSNYYYFIHKIDGIEFGKKQGSDAQIFLYTAPNPDKVVGQWYHYHVKAVGNNFKVWIDGSLVVDYTDNNMAPALASGNINPYTEDAYVQFDNAWVNDLSGPQSPPAAPSILAATAVSGGQINLQWQDNSNDESGFKIERSADGTNFAQIATTGANAVTHSDTGLSASTTYWYRVRAFNSAGDSGYSNIANATTFAPPPAPAAPSGLTATAISSSRIDLSWQDNSDNEDGFKIERSADGTNFNQIATVGAGVAAYSDTGLSASTTYWYRVRAFNAGGDSDYSNTASATTLQQQGVQDLANWDFYDAGTVTGTYADTHTSNDVYESILEKSSGGNPSTRYSYLQHRWTISVTGGSSVTFFVEAHHDANTEGDDFVFAYSTDNVVYTNMLTVTKTVDDDTYQSYALPSSLSGTVYIRVKDTDQTPGNKNFESVYIDRMYIESLP